MRLRLRIDLDPRVAKFNSWRLDRATLEQRPRPFANERRVQFSTAERGDDGVAVGRNADQRDLEDFKPLDVPAVVGERFKQPRLEAVADFDGSKCGSVAASRPSSVSAIDNRALT